MVLGVLSNGDERKAEEIGPGKGGPLAKSHLVFGLKTCNYYCKLSLRGALRQVAVAQDTACGAATMSRAVSLPVHPQIERIDVKSAKGSAEWGCGASQNLCKVIGVPETSVTEVASCHWQHTTPWTGVFKYVL